MNNQQVESIAEAVVDSMGQILQPWNPKNGEGGEVKVESTRQILYENTIRIIKARIEVELR